MFDWSADKRSGGALSGRSTRSSSPVPTLKNAENRRIPFDPQGRLAPIFKRRAQLGWDAFVFGSPDGEFQDSFKTARVDREKVRQIDLQASTSASSS